MNSESVSNAQGKTAIPDDVDAFLAQLSQVVNQGWHVGNDDARILLAIIREQRQAVERETLFDLLERLGNHCHVNAPNKYAHLDADGIRKEIFKFIDCLTNQATDELSDRLAKLEAGLSDITMLLGNDSAKESNRIADAIAKLSEMLESDGAP